MIISVKELSAGSKLAKDVFTEYGSVLLSKEHVLLPRDIEILQAFLIDEVEIVTEGQGSSNKGRVNEPTAKTSTDSNSSSSATQGSLSDKGGVAVAKTTSFEQQYDKMINHIKNAFQTVLVSDLSIYELRAQLESMLEHIDRYNVITFTPSSMKESEYVYHNAVLTALTSYCLAQWIGLPQKDWIQVAFAGLFHDIGNSKVDPAVIHKPSPLNEEELHEMRQHTTYGYQLLKNVKGINEGVRLAALQHHEKVDGSGYPLHLKEPQTHIYARIVSVADIFHAMTLHKTYRKAQSPYLVLEQIQSEAFGKLDPSIVRIFISKVTQLSNGTKVRLNDQRVGEIIFADRDHPTRPMVNLGDEIINLVQRLDLHIEDIIV